MRTLLLAKPAEEGLYKLPQRVYKRVAQAIDRLAQDPVSGSHLLRSTEHGTNLYVIGVGDYRVTYSINQETDTITVIDIFKHKDS